MVHLKIYKVGSVPEAFIRGVEGILSDFYNKVLTGGLKTPVLVEVYVYENTERLRRELERESLEAGVSVIALYSLSHEAWRGWPRIHIDYSMVRGMEGNTLKALLLHEAAHTVLHGGIEYYVVSANPPEDLPASEALRAVYIASTVVKDLEVALLLKELGYKRELEAYLMHSLKDPGSIDCSTLTGLLELAKLLAPAIVLRNYNIKEHMPAECLTLLDDLVETLTGLRGSLDDKIKDLINRIKLILK